MRPGDRVRTVCDLFDRGDQRLVPEGTVGTVDQVSMFGRRLLIDYDNGVSLRQQAHHCQRC